VTEPAPPPGDDRETAEELVHGEVVDALPVLVDVRPLEPARPPAALALAQTAAVAATGFFAGVATAAVLGRRRQRRLGQPAAGTAGAVGPPRAGTGGAVGPARPGTGGAVGPARPGGSFEVVSSRSYLVDVHVLERRG
jgi:hypothetical protein